MLRALPKGGGVASNAGRHETSLLWGTMTTGSPAELENQILDSLDAADDALTPPSTVPLSAAQRRRALDQVLGLITPGPPAS
jgi:hypothetical protein